MSSASRVAVSSDVEFAAQKLFSGHKQGMEFGNLHDHIEALAPNLAKMMLHFIVPTVNRHGRHDVVFLDSKLVNNLLNCRYNLYGGYIYPFDATPKGSRDMYVPGKTILMGVWDQETEWWIDDATLTTGWKLLKAVLEKKGWTLVDRTPEKYSRQGKATMPTHFNFVVVRSSMLDRIKPEQYVKRPTRLAGKSAATAAAVAAAATTATTSTPEEQTEDKDACRHEDGTVSASTSLSSSSYSSALWDQAIVSSGLRVPGTFKPSGSETHDTTGRMVSRFASKNMFDVLMQPTRQAPPPPPPKSRGLRVAAAPYVPAEVKRQESVDGRLNLDLLAPTVSLLKHQDNYPALVSGVTTFTSAATSAPATTSASAASGKPRMTSELDQLLHDSFSGKGADSGYVSVMDDEHVMV